MKIENYRRPKVPVLRILFVIAFLMLIAGIIHTNLSFKPRARQIEIELNDMQDQLDEVMAGLEKIKQEVQP